MKFIDVIRLSEASVLIQNQVLADSVYEISRDVLEMKLKIAVFKSIKELYAGRAERFKKELKEKLKQEENEESKNEEELNRIIHKTLKDDKVVGYRVSRNEINSKLHELADKEFEDRKVGSGYRIKTPEEIVTVTLNIPAQLRTELDSARRDPVILWDRAEFQWNISRMNSFVQYNLMNH
ncbi:uncharacterized protein LOC141907809 [Tubulanus polymorphus]|uniref:uncharacterized protein LOC141907809 n=1 Tax=Tubulanus polymorphus TaxID=672921 RepID=UPI003DA25DF5